jgi:hypothetical protein
MDIFFELLPDQFVRGLFDIVERSNGLVSNPILRSCEAIIGYDSWL